jgi:hypothetical protein
MQKLNKQQLPEGTLYDVEDKRNKAFVRSADHWKDSKDVSFIDKVIEFDITISSSQAATGAPVTINVDSSLMPSEEVLSIVSISRYGQVWKAHKKFSKDIINKYSTYGFMASNSVVYDATLRGYSFVVQYYEGVITLRSIIMGDFHFELFKTLENKNTLYHLGVGEDAGLIPRIRYPNVIIPSAFKDKHTGLYIPKGINRQQLSELANPNGFLDTFVPDIQIATGERKYKIDGENQWESDCLKFKMTNINKIIFEKIRHDTYVGLLIYKKTKGTEKRWCLIDDTTTGDAHWPCDNDDPVRQPRGWSEVIAGNPPSTIQHSNSINYTTMRLKPLPLTYFLDNAYSNNTGAFSNSWLFYPHWADQILSRFLRVVNVDNNTYSDFNRLKVLMTDDYSISEVRGSFILPSGKKNSHILVHEVDPIQDSEGKMINKRFTYTINCGLAFLRDAPYLDFDNRMKYSRIIGTPQYFKIKLFTHLFQGHLQVLIKFIINNSTLNNYHIRLS